MEAATVRHNGSCCLSLYQPRVHSSVNSGCTHTEWCAISFSPSHSCSWSTTKNGWVPQAIHSYSHTHTTHIRVAYTRRYDHDGSAKDPLASHTACTEHLCLYHRIFMHMHERLRMWTRAPVCVLYVCCVCASVYIYYIHECMRVSAATARSKTAKPEIKKVNCFQWWIQYGGWYTQGSCGGTAQSKNW